jgi:glutaredoxin
VFEGGRIQMSQNILYTISGCHKCQQAKEYLSSKRIEFQEINILEQPEFITDLKSLVGEITTPVFYMNEKVYIGKHIYTISNYS